MIKAYTEKNSTNNYNPNDCLELYAYIKPVCTVNDGSITHSGIVVARYFFKTGEYFCTGSIKNADGSYRYAYLDDSLFPLLYTLFEKQKKDHIQDVAQQEEIEQKLKALAFRRAAQKEAKRQRRKAKASVKNAPLLSQTTVHTACDRGK